MPNLVQHGALVFMVHSEEPTSSIAMYNKQETLRTYSNRNLESGVENQTFTSKTLANLKDTV